MKAKTTAPKGNQMILLTYYSCKAITIEIKLWREAFCWIKRFRSNNYNNADLHNAVHVLYNSIDIDLDYK